MESIEILIDIRKIVRSINLESKRIQKDFGVSIPQLLCLNYLSKQEGFQSSQKDLTRFLHLNSSTVTGIISRLEKKGYIAKLPKKDDKRLTNIVLTSSGDAILQNSPPLLHEKLNVKLSGLPEAQIKLIKESLMFLIQALDIEDLDASPLLTIEEPISN